MGRTSKNKNIEEPNDALEETSAPEVDDVSEETSAPEAVDVSEETDEPKTVDADEATDASEETDASEDADLSEEVETAEDADASEEAKVAEDADTSEEPDASADADLSEVVEESEEAEATEATEADASEQPTELLEKGVNEQPTELLEDDISDQPTELLDEEAIEMERKFARQRVEDETDAVDALHEDDDAVADDARLTALLKPIGPNEHTVMPVSQGPTDTVWHTIEQGENRIRHKVAAAVISVLVMFGIGLGAGLYKQHLESEADTAARIAENERLAAEAQAAQEKAEAEAEAQRQAEAARAPRDLKFIISAPDYDLLSTRIPMSITGTDLEGNAVDTVAFINAEGDGVSLAPGEYTGTIPASPVRSNGVIYRVPSDTFDLRIPNNDGSAVQIDQAIALIPLSIAEYTEDAVNAAYEWGIKDERNASVVEENVAEARRILEEEVARAQAEELRKQNLELRPPLAQQFAESFFTNLRFTDDGDDSQVQVETNWTDVVGQYTSPGSQANAKVANGNGARYSYATYVSATDISGDTVTVEVKVVSSNEIKNGWTLNSSNKTMTCTFDDYNKIIDFTVS